MDNFYFSGFFMTCFAYRVKPYYYFFLLYLVGINVELLIRFLVSFEFSLNQNL